MIQVILVYSKANKFGSVYTTDFFLTEKMIQNIAFNFPVGYLSVLRQFVNSFQQSWLPTPMSNL